MRRAGLGILGFLGGAFVGFGATLLFVWLWYDVLALDNMEGGAKAGLGALVRFGPVAMIGFGAFGAWRAIARDRAGRGALPVVLLGVLGIGLLVWIAAMLGLA